MLNRRTMIASLAAFGLVPAAVASAAQPVFYRNPGCGCCHAWTERMAAAGLPVALEDSSDLAASRRSSAFPQALEGCHVGEIEGYVISGHVPPADIKRLLAEKPDAAGPPGARHAHGLARHGDGRADRTLRCAASGQGRQHQRLCHARLETCEPNLTKGIASMDAIGIDFGTTNTVLAFPGTAAPACRALRSAPGRLKPCAPPFPSGATRHAGARPLAEAGPWAIQDFIDAPEDTRFLQSFKSFAASASFTDTAVFTSRYRFEDLMAAYLDKLKEHAGLAAFPKRLAIGRPVTFAGHSPDDALAQRRYARGPGAARLRAGHLCAGACCRRVFLRPAADARCGDPRGRSRWRHQRLLGPALPSAGGLGGSAGPQRHRHRGRQFRLPHHRQCGLAAARQARNLYELGQGAFPFRSITSPASRAGTSSA